MKSLAEKKLIAAEIAANVHRKIVCEEAKNLMIMYTRDELFFANVAMMNSAAITARQLMSKVDFAKLEVALQKYKERVKQTCAEEVPE